MNEFVAQMVMNGGAGGVVVFFLYLLSKLIDKHKPRKTRSEQDDEHINALQDRIRFLTGEVEACQKDIRQLRAGLRSMSQERHYFYDAITRCMVEHPATADWWKQELDTIRFRLEATRAEGHAA
ncbi:MAG: hypothetical protein NXI11_04025 [Proteobacteria bacterium]|nr:hypothetical protein [Pseudomonadota bacterium]